LMYDKIPAVQSTAVSPWGGGEYNEKVRNCIYTKPSIR
jgi:hypothetical protein